MLSSASFTEILEMIYWVNLSRIVISDSHITPVATTSVTELLMPGSPPGYKRASGHRAAPLPPRGYSQKQICRT